MTRASSTRHNHSRCVAFSQMRIRTAGSTFFPAIGPDAQEHSCSHAPPATTPGALLHCFDTWFGRRSPDAVPTQQLSSYVKQRTDRGSANLLDGTARVNLCIQLRRFILA